MSNTLNTRMFNKYKKVSEWAGLADILVVFCPIQTINVSILRQIIFFTEIIYIYISIYILIGIPYWGALLGP